VNITIFTASTYKT